MILLNEKDYVEDCLNNNTLKGKPYFSLVLISRYLYQYKGYKKQRIEKELVNILETSYKDYHYNRLYWEDNIDKIAKKAGRRKLFESDGVWITDKELTAISSLGDDILERLAFTLLCVAKLNNQKNPQNNNWVNIPYKDIFKMARINCSVKERYVYLNKIYMNNMLQLPKKLDNLNCRVIYLDESGNNILHITDFRELGYEYMKYKGGNFVRCAECGRLMRDNKMHNKKYCSECAANLPKRAKTIRCIDCGKEFSVSVYNSRQNRCKECYEKYRKRYYAENKAMKRMMKENKEKCPQNLSK